MRRWNSAYGEISIAREQHSWIVVLSVESGEVADVVVIRERYGRCSRRDGSLERGRRCAFWIRLFRTEQDFGRAQLIGHNLEDCEDRAGAYDLHCTAIGD